MDTINWIPKKVTPQTTHWNPEHHPLSNPKTHLQNQTIHLHFWGEISSRSFCWGVYTLQGTNISHQNSLLKIIFLFPRWDMLIPWRVPLPFFHKGHTPHQLGLEDKSSSSEKEKARQMTPPPGWFIASLSHHQDDDG